MPSLSLLAALAAASPPSFDDQPLPHPTWAWLATQLAPSSEWQLGDEGGFALHWQLTPLSYAWGIDRRLNRLRTLVVEPYARYGGSVELYGVAGLRLTGDTHSLFRAGVRAYWPLVGRGEYLSFSAGASYQRWGEHNQVAFESGIYVLFGILGLQASYLPVGPTRSAISVRLRYF
ncbi:MAG: hypothetical protein AAFU79_11170 [Myxococcota bacterium]